MRRLLLALALVATLAGTAGCRTTLDTHDMGVGAKVAPVWQDNDQGTGPNLGVGLDVSGPKGSFELMPFGSPDGDYSDETKEELQAQLDEQAKRIEELQAAGKLTPEQYQQLKDELAAGRKTVAEAPTSKDEAPPIGEIIAQLIAGNWWAAILLLLAWIFRRFLGRAVVRAGVGEVVSRIREQIDAYDKEPFVAADGTTASEDQLVKAATSNDS